MALAAYTYNTTRTPLPNFKAGEVTNGEEFKHFVMCAGPEGAKESLVGFGSQRCRRALEGAYVIMGIALAIVGILGLTGHLPICGYTSGACLALGAYFLLDGGAATIIDLVRHFTRPKFEDLKDDDGKVICQTAKYPVRADGKQVEGKCVIRAKKGTVAVGIGTDEGVSDFLK